MLNYINKLRGQCPEGQELQFFKIGGKVCKKCAKKVTMEDSGKTPTNVVDAFKCGRKMKKKKAEAPMRTMIKERKKEGLRLKGKGRADAKASRQLLLLCIPAIIGYILFNYIFGYVICRQVI